jgi:hypothetical protein
VVCGQTFGVGLHCLNLRKRVFKYRLAEAGDITSSYSPQLLIYGQKPIRRTVEKGGLYTTLSGGSGNDLSKIHVSLTCGRSRREFELLTRITWTRHCTPNG